MPTEPALREPAAAAAALGVSAEAVSICWDLDLIDLHVDTFIPARLWGYEPLERHGQGVFRGRFFQHLDLPRATDGGLDGAMWSITTQPFKSAAARWRTFQRNVERFRAWVDGSGGALRFATSAAAFRDARAAGAHACLLSVQGGNALEAAPADLAGVPTDLLTRVTLVHLTPSKLGGTSSPLQRFGAAEGLTDRGRTMVEALDHHRIFVDLAHIHPRAFWDAVEAHDPSRPLICTHTGVNGVHPHWRNLSDDQLRAVADTGGTIGVMFHRAFLGPGDYRAVVEHLDHIIAVVGEDHASLGSDYDGAVTPPEGLEEADTYPRLVQAMLDRGWSPARIEKVLAGNFLRAFEALRPS